MHPKLYTNLYEAIDKFVDDNCSTDEWEQTDFWTPENMVKLMTDAASSVFEMAVLSSKFTKEQEQG